MKLFDKIPYLENDRIVIKQVNDSDADALMKMTRNDTVYRYFPTFLFEKKFDDVQIVIREMYKELFASKKSLILGIYPKEFGCLCGLAEFYGYKEDIQKTCVGYRLDQPYWGKGIASGTVKLMVDYLYAKTDTEIITASTMIENKASARVLMKNGFIRTATAVPEDWGYDSPTVADKWFR
ncbi:MAG: GNAT family N-acetyltransferase [Ruminiclostridium sp.]|nr:GNAT family N-acetyltransferase [Ruminiclostridium sp.]